jgi:hypothetical protein
MKLIDQGGNGHKWSAFCKKACTRNYAVMALTDLSSNFGKVKSP